MSMPVTTVWYNEEKTLLITKFEGRWTINEFAAALDEIAAMTDGISHPICAIADGRHSAGVPRGNLLPHLRRMFQLPLVHIVSIAGSTLAEAILNALTSLDPNWRERITFMTDYDEAIRIQLARYNDKP